MNQDNIHSALPEKLEFSIGGYGGPGYSVSLQDEKVVYRSFQGVSAYSEDETVLTPTDQQWREFKAQIDQIGVWDWEKEYNNPNVLDGTQWSLEIAYDEQRIQSCGSNRFPGASTGDWDDWSETSEFKALKGALQQLLCGVYII